MDKDAQHLERLRSRFNRGEKLGFVFFWGSEQSLCGIDDACLSQWYESPFDLDGRRFLATEHFMMAEKASLFGDDVMRDQLD